MSNEQIETVLEVGQIIKLGNRYGKVTKNTTNPKLNKSSSYKKNMLVVSYFASVFIDPTSGEITYTPYNGWDSLTDNRNYSDNESTLNKITKIWDCHPCYFAVVDFGDIQSLEKLELGKTDIRECYEFVWEKEKPVEIIVDDEKFEVSDETAEKVLEILYADQESFGFIPVLTPDVTVAPSPWQQPSSRTWFDIEPSSYGIGW
jgi:hypothetical protein